MQYATRVVILVVLSIIRTYLWGNAQYIMLTNPAIHEIIPRGTLPFDNPIILADNNAKLVIIR